MLAQNFKTPIELKITDAEFDALYKVLGMLERGEVDHTDARTPTIPNGFNMAVVRRSHRCGTAACIFGWARTVNPMMTGTGTPGLFELFTAINFKVHHQLDLEKVTVSQAAIALRNYLTHGEPRWAEAIA